MPTSSPFQQAPMLHNPRHYLNVHGLAIPYPCTRVLSFHTFHTRVHPTRASGHACMQISGFKSCFGGEELSRAIAALTGDVVGGTIRVGGARSPTALIPWLMPWFGGLILPPPRFPNPHTDLDLQISGPALSPLATDTGFIPALGPQFDFSDDITPSLAHLSTLSPSFNAATSTSLPAVGGAGLLPPSFSHATGPTLIQQNSSGRRSHEGNQVSVLPTV